MIDPMKSVFEFPLMSALVGRRARRFALGAKIDSGPLAFTSQKPPLPLDDLEKALVLCAMTGNTGWHHAIPFNAKYAPHLPNYAAAAGGRTFPSAAGFHTSDLFFTDDSGVYFLSTRDLPAQKPQDVEGDFDPSAWLAQHQKRIRQISDQRLQIPVEEPHIESHNLWIANRPGSLFAIPVVDLAQHMLLGLCYWVQNGFGVYNDVHKEKIPGLEKFGHMIDLNNLYPLSYGEQIMLGEAAVEVSTSCFSGALVLQAMGLGGWMYDGVDRHSIFGVSGDPRNKGLGFVGQTHPDWSTPNPTGLPGIFEGHCPPHFTDMRAAVESVVQRKFGENGPFHRRTEGPWKESSRVRGAAAPHSEEFKECVTLIAQYIFDRFGKFPATIPSMYCLMFLQAHHLDLEFYDTHYKEGAYLHTHAEHFKKWHSR